MRFIRDLFVFLIVMAVGAMAINMMIQGELFMASDPEVATQAQSIDRMIEGLKTYFIGMGSAFLVTAIAWILVDRDEELSTVFEKR